MTEATGGDADEDDDIDAGDLYTVVFDVNVYLDAAKLMVPPFSWPKFEIAAIRWAKTPLPNADRRVDALRALALCRSGRFAGPHELQVWTSDHINRLVATKAHHELNWSIDESQDLAYDCVGDLAYDYTQGGSVGPASISRGAPPLSHEDGQVYATALDAGLQDPRTRYSYCVTSDRQFHDEAPFVNVTTLYPYEWVQLNRAARFNWSMSTMPRRPDTPGPVG